MEEILYFFVNIFEYERIFVSFHRIFRVWKNILMQLENTIFGTKILPNQVIIASIMPIKFILIPVIVVSLDDMQFPQKNGIKHKQVWDFQP